MLGSFLVKEEVTKCTKGKAYGLMFNCLTIRAVDIGIAHN